MRLLETLGLPARGVAVTLSRDLASALLTSHRSHIFAHGHLDRTVVMVPLYHGAAYHARGSTTREANALFRSGVPTRMLRRKEAKLSLACVLATWRIGGIVAPITPEVLLPPRCNAPVAIGGPDRIFESIEPSDQELLPAALTQWTPGIVMNFGSLSDTLSRMVSTGSLWSHPGIASLNVDLQLMSQPQGNDHNDASNIKGVLANDADIDLDAIAVELPGGERLTYGTVLAAVEDTAFAPPLDTAEGALVSLLRSAQRRFSSLSEGRPPPFWASGPGGRWPPQRLPSQETPWAEAVDSASGRMYFWNRDTDETAWEVPSRGRRSRPLSSAHLGHRLAALAASTPRRGRRRTASTLSETPVRRVPVDNGGGRGTAALSAMKRHSGRLHYELQICDSRRPGKPLRIRRTRWHDQGLAITT